MFAGLPTSKVVNGMLGDKRLEARYIICACGNVVSNSTAVVDPVHSQPFQCHKFINYFEEARPMN